jgi:hypothetical protein
MKYIVDFKMNYSTVQEGRLFLQSSELGPPPPPTRLKERGWGVPIRTRGKHCVTLGIYVLCGVYHKIN